MRGGVRLSGRHGPRLAGLVAVVAAAAAVTALTANAAVVVTFNVPCSVQAWSVPAGVTSVTIDAYGASGGNGDGNMLKEGHGARATATIAVTPGESLQVAVGSMGSNGVGSFGGAAGCNGGSSGGDHVPTTISGSGGGGGGGGASDVRQGGTTVAHRVVIAAGGGGAGGGALGGFGGDGGDPVGGSGTNGGGTGGGLGGPGGPAGGPGPGVSTEGTDGEAGGGGGGGGSFGGTGGIAGGSGGGGGGGSSFAVATATNVTLTTGSRLGGGLVTITYDQTTTAVTLRSLSATRTRSGVLVRWSVASSVDAVGYHLYRDRAGTRVRVNRRLVPATGRLSYAFLDRNAPRTDVVRYWIQVIGLDGSRRWHGPARAAKA